VYRFLLAALTVRCGDRPAVSLTPGEVEAFSRRPTWSVTTRRCFIDAAIAALRWAADRRRRLIPENPLVGIRKPPKASRGRSSVIQEADYLLLIGRANPALRDLLVLLWETGARPSEVCRLTAADVDLRGGVAVLTEHKTDATGRPRLLALTPAASDVLRPLVSRYPTGPVVRRMNGTPWDVDTLNTAVRALRKRVGVPHATAYGFRHTFATDALVRGVPDAHVAALLGHRNTDMLHRNYSHLIGQMRVLQESLAKVRTEHSSAANN
jgi:integrase